MPTRTLRLASAVALACTFACGAVQAQGLKPSAVFVQGGSGEDSVRAVSVGALWPWAWRTTLWGGEVSAQTELFVSNWRAREFGGGHQNFLQLGLVPLFRLTPDAGKSPWFFEAGIGLAIHDQRFVTPDKTFSTRWNFSDNFAVGRAFGAKNQHEVSLRWQHTSNGGAKKPNPGLDLVLVRYTAKF